MGALDQVDAVPGVDRITVVGAQTLQPKPIAETSMVPRFRLSMIFLSSRARARLVVVVMVRRPS